MTSRGIAVILTALIIACLLFVTAIVPRLAWP
jgi:hypothetical protein